jgi:hypothetical protein
MRAATKQLNLPGPAAAQVHHDPFRPAGAKGLKDEEMLVLEVSMLCVSVSGRR